MAKRDKYSRVGLKKGGEKSFLSALFSPDISKIGYSKSYIGKLRNIAKKTGYIPENVKDKLSIYLKEEVKDVIPLKYGKKVNIPIEKKLIRKHTKKKGYIWVKMKISNNGVSTWVSATLEASRGKNLQKFINGFINNQLTKYSGVKTSIESITLENI